MKASTIASSAGNCRRNGCFLGDNDSLLLVFELISISASPCPVTPYELQCEDTRLANHHSQSVLCPLYIRSMSELWQLYMPGGEMSLLAAMRGLCADI